MLKLEKKRSFHPYFTTQSNSLVSSYIKKYSNKKDLILDSFCGSGVTLLESQLLSRYSIGFDVSRLACLISDISTTSFKNQNKLDKQFENIIDKFEKKKTSKEKLKFKRTIFKNYKLPKNADLKNVKDLFTKKNLLHLKILKSIIDEIENKKYKLLFLSIFSGILHRASKTFFYDKLKWGGGNSSIFTKYRYWVPKKPDERDVLNLFKIRFSRMKSVIKKTNSNLNELYKPRIINRSSTNLDIVKSNSVDYIYIDPPYGANISYLDLSTMWYAWLFTDSNPDEFKNEEVIEGGDLSKNQETYLNLLEKSVEELSRVLKYNKFLTLAFSHKDLNLWFKISQIFQKYNFNYVKIDYYPSFYSSFHKLKSTQSVLTGQIVITFKKEKIFRLKKEKIFKDQENFILRLTKQFLIKKDMSLEEIIKKLVLSMFKNKINFTNLKISSVLKVCKENFKYNKNKNEWSFNR